MVPRYFRRSFVRNMRTQAKTKLSYIIYKIVIAFDLLYYRCKENIQIIALTYYFTDLLINFE